MGGVNASPYFLSYKENQMLTKLEAVNIVLDSIGETPVSSLTSGLPDAESAEAKLDEVTTEVLAKRLASKH